MSNLSNSFRPPESSEVITIGHDELHLWTFNHGEFESDLTELRSWMSADEVTKAERFVTEKLQTSFVLSRSFLRGLLAKYLRCHPREVSFTLGAYGKPSLAATDSDSQLSFNLAHSGVITLCAVGLSKDIGVDVEQMRDIDDMENIARRFFAPLEVARLNALPECEKKEAFFRCWTAKEAFIKATGEGLSRPLDSFTVSFLPAEESKICTSDDSSRWCLQYLEPGLSGYAAALVTGGSERGKLSTYRWTF